MATKRFLRTSIDWAAFSERIPSSEKPKFHQFKAKADGYTQKMMSYPEKPPAIDFSMYRNRVPNRALVDEFEKQFNSLKVPYPADKFTVQVDEQEKNLDTHLKEYKEIVDLTIQYYNKQAQWWKDMMPFVEMTREDFHDYFPDPKYDPYQTPSFWPHDEPGRPVFPYREKKDDH